MIGWFGRMGPWAIAVVASLAFLGASTAYLAVAVIDNASEEESLPPTPTITPFAAGSVEPADERVRFSGMLESGLDPDGFIAVATGDAEDLVFSVAPSTDTGTIALRHFVPIVSPDVGIYGLTSSQLSAALGGTTADWSEAGGLDGAITVIGPLTDDLRVVGVWLGDVQLAASEFGSYAEVVEAVAEGPGVIVIVPLENVDPSVVAIAVDELDLVRGRGAPDSWPFREVVAVTALTPEGVEARALVVELLQEKIPAIATVAMTGDILQSRCTLTKIRASGDWGSPLRSPVGEFLAEADLAFGSLDGSIQDISAPYGCLEMTNLSSPPETLEALTLAGFDGLTVATNHVFDCGQVGYCGDRAFLRTLELLSSVGIEHWGGGKNLEEALQPGIFEVGQVRFGVLGFDDVAAYELEATDTRAGTAPLDDDYTEEIAANEPSFFRPASELTIVRFLERIEALRQEVDVVIVQVQTGTENTHDPSSRSLKALPAAIAAGADLVVGNQAHWVQAVQYSPSSFTAYALGNFIFDQVHTPEFTEGVILEATFHGDRLVNVRLRPYVIEDQFRPAFVEGDRALKILGDIRTASETLAAKGQ